MTERRAFIGSVLLSLIVLVPSNAQPADVYHIGVLLAGGPYAHAVEGLRDGLKEGGLNEGAQYVFHIRDTKGDLKAAEEAARTLELEGVDVIFSIPASVSLAAKRATTKVPIVFFVGSDPVAFGLVSGYAKPGGRVTGVYSLSQEATAKRLEVLQQIAPKIHSVAIFYNPDNPVVGAAVNSVREAAQQLGITLVEREVRSGDALQSSLRTLEHADALFLVTDATVESRASLLIETAKVRKWPTMFYDRSLVADGGLASYGVSFYAGGRLAAKYIRQILSGVRPADLPVERLDRFEFVLNMTTAREIGLSIPQSVLLRANEVIP